MRSVAFRAGPVVAVARKKLYRVFGDRVERPADVGALALIVVLVVVCQWRLMVGGTIVGMDSATQYLPWYSYLGESLRSGTVPAWNPHLFSGAPFAADPLSGWTYLPAMAFFALLPLAAAAKAFMLFHPLLAGLSTYLFGRALRLGPAGALLAAVAYAFSGYLYVRNTCCFPYASVAAWLPLALLGAELAIRSDRWLDRGLWWGVSGLAISQILASWLGQGSYYALLTLGAYTAYRTLVVPPRSLGGGLWGLRKRLVALPLHGGAVLVFGFGLSAAGVLPRLEYAALSSLASGYSGAVGGWTGDAWEQLFVRPGANYAGAAVLALAIAALPIVGWRFAAPLFAALALSALALSGGGLTVLHSALYLLPGFERLHPHYPQRAMLVFYLCAALLAGAALTGLGERGLRKSLLALPLLAGVFLVTRSAQIPPVKPPKGTGLWGASPPWLLGSGVSVLPGPLIILAVVLALAAAYALIPARLGRVRGLAATLLALAVFADLYGAGREDLDRRSGLSGADAVAKVDLTDYYAPTAGTRFLESRDPGRDRGPFRYFGYDPRGNGKGGFVPSYIRWTKPEFRALGGENRALAVGGGLQGIQGYNAVHLARYDDYLEALNGLPQNYHDAEIFPEGVDSPLLDLLGVRYAVASTDVTAEQLILDGAGFREVYEEGPGAPIRVLENPGALPRAWIVHSARRANPDEALRLLASGAVDPRETALVEGPTPPLARPDDPAEDRASVTGYEANRIQLSTATGAPGLLVLGEVYYPAWKAYVDGEPARVLNADHLFRGVPVPAGEHTVELRYESWSLRAGMAVSLAALAAFLGLVFAKARSAKARSAGARP